MDKDLIGIWSGIIWRTLNERGKLSVQGPQDWSPRQSMPLSDGWRGKATSALTTTRNCHYTSIMNAITDTVTPETPVPFRGRRSPP